MELKAKYKQRVPDWTNGLPGEDRISGLDDAVLCHILSFLETIHAVRTCVLSRRWKNIWAYVPTLDFNCGTFRKSSKLTMFADYVFFLRNSTSIQKLRLSWSYDGIDQYSINRWMHIALKRNVAELDLLVYSRLHSHTFELPESIFMCKTLVILKLRSNFIVNLPSSRCFPSLKILHVIINEYSCNDSMAMLFSSCPVLEDLTINGYTKYRDDSVLKVAAPALKTLRICWDSHTWQYNHSIIDCPKLVYLILKGDVSLKYSLGKPESLIKASIELLHSFNEDPCFFRGTSLMAGVSSVKFLCLSAHCFKVDSLPAFDNLIELKLVIHKCFSWELLTEFLSRSPHLQCLVLVHSATSCEGNALKHEADSEPEKDPKQRWQAPELVPSCLVSNLETISIEGFKGQLNTMEVVKYFLRNGEVLKKMTILSDPLSAGNRALDKELSMVPRVSVACTVDFV